MRVTRFELPMWRRVHQPSNPSGLRLFPAWARMSGKIVPCGSGPATFGRVNDETLKRCLRAILNNLCLPYVLI